MRGDCLSGLYAAFSISTPSTVQPITAAISAIMGLAAKRAIIIHAMYAPTIITSPWAKFNSIIIPYTMLYPSATSAYIEPDCRPFISCFIIVVNTDITIEQTFQKSFLCFLIYKGVRRVKPGPAPKHAHGKRLFLPRLPAASHRERSRQ